MLSWFSSIPFHLLFPVTNATPAPTSLRDPSFSDNPPCRCCLLGQSGLDRLEDLDLDTGLGLVLLGSVGSDDTLGIGETGSDGLFSVVFVVVQMRGFGIDQGL